MSTNPRFINGILVPYNLSIAELTTLVDSYSNNRWAAFVALGCKLEPEALEVLQNKLRSPDWSVRRAAAEAIGYHRYGERAQSELIRLLHDKSPHVASTACQSLGKLKVASELAHSELIGLLHNDEPADVVRAACQSLGKLKVGSSHDHILNLLKSKDPTIRLVALQTLCIFWQDSDFDLVLKTMQADSSEDVRKEAAWTLWRCAETSKWKILFAAWQESKLSRERVWACRLAGKYGDDSYAITLQKLAGDKDGHVRKSAQRALQTMSNRSEIRL
jgi:HEAT repeat protein